MGFPKEKFPPQKAIYISLLKETGIHRENSELGYHEMSRPDRNSNLYNLWMESEAFLESSLSNKRNLAEFYELLSQKPYKLKKGFVDFWIPIFLIAKKEDFGLFHTSGGFIPFITEDTIDLIHKKPQDFLVKSYDVSGLKVNLLESYKELVQIGDADGRGVQSTFLSIFGNFLRFQRSLNKYTLKTNKLSNKAIKLREAIVKSKDPEDALFNLFPTALGFHSISIKEDEDVLYSFTRHIQEAIREIRSAYDELLIRVENSIISAFLCDSNNFSEYKEQIESQISEINQSALGKTQNVFFKRLVSPLDDRISWLKSVADVALGKSLEELLDEEEILLMDSIKELSLGLIKASEISKFNRNTEKGKLYSFGFYGESGEFISDRLIVENEISPKFRETKNKIVNEINSLEKDKRKELLVELLSKELNL